MGRHLRRSLGIPDDAKVLLFVGRLHPKKRPDIAVAVLAEAQSFPFPVHLIIAGPDEARMYGKIVAQAKTARCENNLHLLGLLEENQIADAFDASDILLMPSEPESENFGMSAVEAMASGLPVLVSEGVPAGVWAKEGGAGYMVKCDPFAFVKATCELLSDSSQLETMGQKAKNVAQKFDKRIITQQLLAQYRSIVETGQPL